MNRRNFIRSAGGILIAAPMVVRAETIMKVRQLRATITDQDLELAASILAYRFKAFPVINPAPWGPTSMLQLRPIGMLER